MRTRSTPICFRFSNASRQLLRPDDTVPAALVGITMLSCVARRYFCVDRVTMKRKRLAASFAKLIKAVMFSDFVEIVGIGSNAHFRKEEHKS
jgi:hypothetical protein